MKVENIQYKVYTDNVNLLCSNSKNMHDSDKYQISKSGFLRGKKGWNESRGSGVQGCQLYSFLFKTSKYGKMLIFES